MMGVPAISLNEKKRNIVSIVTSIVSFLCMLVYLGILSAGAYIQVVIESKTRFLEGFDTAVLPAFIMFIGIYGLSQNLVCCVVFFKIRQEKKRIKMSKLLLPIVISGVVLSLFALVVGLVCFALIPQLDKSYGKGILKAMKTYRTHQPTKYEIDMLQIVFECCGSNDYRDWFGINWINHDYLVNKKGINMDSKIGYTNDDVPFSCCSPKAKRPCIHHHIHDNHVHYNYDYKVATTINRMGCKQALTTFYGNGLLTHVGIFILSSLLVQILVVLITRILQTSIIKAVKGGDLTETTTGYLFPTKADKEEKGGEGKPLLEESDEESDKEDGKKEKKGDGKKEKKEDEKKEKKDKKGKPKEPTVVTSEHIYDNIGDIVKNDEEPIYANIGPGSGRQDDAGYELPVPVVDDEFDSATHLPSPMPPPS